MSAEVIQALESLRADLRALREQVAAMMKPAATGEVLTRDEAKEYVKRRSEGAFFDWCKQWRIKPAYRGRYSRTQLDAALNQEARKRR